VDPYANCHVKRHRPSTNVDSNQSDQSCAQAANPAPDQSIALPTNPLALRELIDDDDNSNSNDNEDTSCI
jgi:hypothetical protein